MAGKHGSVVRLSLPLWCSSVLCGCGPRADQGLQRVYASGPGEDWAAQGWKTPYSRLSLEAHAHQWCLGLLTQQAAGDGSEQGALMVPKEEAAVQGAAHALQDAMGLGLAVQDLVGAAAVTQVVARAPAAADMVSTPVVRQAVGVVLVAWPLAPWRWCGEAGLGCEAVAGCWVEVWGETLHAQEQVHKAAEEEQSSPRVWGWSPGSC